MSRTLGQPIHHCYVVPDFDAELARFAAGGIGPIYTMRIDGSTVRYNGADQSCSVSVAFFYSGDMCVEVITPNGPQTNAYADYLRRNPAGGLHHIAYHSADHAASLAAMAAAGTPLRVVQEMFDQDTGHVFEIYCEPVGIENGIMYQLLYPGLFDSWFETMRQAAQDWDGTEPIRDAMALMNAAMAEAAA
ncbi:MAG TPA: VOC family protein [Novosphingobium sp.]|nr:VOC family protein [Novosphingobium sp.]